MAWRGTRGERGQILILTALTMTVLLATAALSIDAAYMYDRRNILHSAADDAAKSAAIERWRSGQADISAFAMLALGARLNVNPSTLTPAPIVRACNAPGATCNAKWAGSPTYVEVIVGQDTLTFFGRIIGWTSLTPTVRSVAGTSNSNNCMYILGTSPTALTIGNNTTLSMPGCGIASNGGMDLKPNSVIDANDVTIGVGSCQSVPNCSVSTVPVTDPLAYLTPPAAPSHTCTSEYGPVTSVETINVTDIDKYYCGMKIDNGTVNLGPGTYYIAGPIHAKNPGSNITINGSDLTLYFAPGGSIDLTSNFVSLNLSASLSGPYKAILMYQDPSNPIDAVISKNNGDMISLTGALYFPNAKVTVKNNDGLTNGCAVIVVKEYEMKNNGNFSNTCSLFGGSPLTTITMAE